MQRTDNVRNHDTFSRVSRRLLSNDCVWSLLTQTKGSSWVFPSLVTPNLTYHGVRPPPETHLGTSSSFSLYLWPRKENFPVVWETRITNIYGNRVGSSFVNNRWMVHEPKPLRLFFPPVIKYFPTKIRWTTSVDVRSLPSCMLLLPDHSTLDYLSTCFTVP